MIYNMEDLITIYKVSTPSLFLKIPSWEFIKCKKEKSSKQCTNLHIIEEQIKIKAHAETLNHVSK